MLLKQIASIRSDYSEAQLAWLQDLIADWHILADLSFSDLVLWLPELTDGDLTGWQAVAQVRPATGPTAYLDDISGTQIGLGKQRLVDLAWQRKAIAREGYDQWSELLTVAVEAIPVVKSGQVLAVISRTSNTHGVRTPSRLELAYLSTAKELTQMIAAGNFPQQREHTDHTDTPRVGDGFIRLDAAGRVTYASPNAVSAYRKLGWREDLTGQELAQLTQQLMLGAVSEAADFLSLTGRYPTAVEIGNSKAWLVYRAIPLLTAAGAQQAGLLLVRDVTELRRRDSELITKDTTIREIHHRVKNNLQTVAALLRLQARRIDSTEAQLALQEAERRVGAIAMVHEMLSQTLTEQVDFDPIADQILRSMVTLAPQVQLRTEGSLGTVSAEVATALAMSVTELLQNAIQHGTAAKVPEIWLRFQQHPVISIEVTDNGSGIPAGFDVDQDFGLGLSIVKSLITELAGELNLENLVSGGTVARVSLGASDF